MAVAPKPVNTRKIALVREYGVHEADVPACGVTGEYFDVIGTRPTIVADDPLVRVVAVAVVDERPRWRVYWRERDLPRVAEAIGGDYREMICSLDTPIPGIHRNE